MKTHTAEFKQKIKEQGKEIKSIITYTLNNEEIVLSNEQLNSVSPHYEGSILKSVMRQLDLDSNVEIPIGTIFNYQFGIKIREPEGNDDGYDYINFGNYIVYSSEKQEDVESYKIVAYDKMLYSMIDYFNMELTYPITVRNYISAICTNLGLVFKNATDTFANYDKEIQNELYLDSDNNSLGYTFRDVFDELAQVTASTICINEDDDELEIRYINDAINETTTVVGDNFTINDSQSNEILNLELKGNSYQNDVPTPNNIQSINVVNGEVTLAIRGKNLFDGKWVNGQINSSTGQLVPTGNARSSENYIPIQPETTYTMSRSTTVNSIPLRYYKKDKTYIGAATGISSSNTESTITTPAEAYFLKIVDWSKESENVQIELGETATEYEQYEGQIYSINLGSLELCSTPDGDIRDYIYGTTNNWYKKQYIGKTILKGNESGWVNDNDNAPYRIDISGALISNDNNAVPKIFTNYFRPVSYNSSWSLYDSLVSAGEKYYSSRLKFRYTAMSSLNDFKTWLSTHNVVVYYVLQTPIDVKITNNTLISELNNMYENLELYNGNNQISIIGGGNPKVAIEYISEYETIDEEYLKNINVNFGEKYGPINSIVLSRAGGSDNVYLSDDESVTENGLCELKISDNQIMNFNDRSDYLPDILGVLDGLEYYINDFESGGIGYYNVCDRYNVKIGNNLYSCIMFNDEFNVTQGLEENIHTDIPIASETDYTKADKTDRRINQTYIIVDKQNQEIEALAERIVDVSATVSGVQSITLENAYKGSLHQLSIKGQISLLFPAETTQYGYTLVPKDGLTPSNSLVPSNPVPYGNEVLYPSSNLFTKNNILLVDDIEYHLDFDYLNYINNTICDEFVYEDGKCKIIRRIGIDNNGNKYALDEEIIEERKDIDIKVNKNSVIRLKSFDNTILSSTYLLDNEYTDTFVPSIDLISRINLTPGEATIEARKIKLEGYTTINENFGVDLEGNMWAKNGSFSGNIYLDNGSKVLGGSGLMSVLRFGSNGWSPVGFEFEYSPYGAGSYEDWQYLNAYIDYYLPKNFTITEAYIILSATPVQTVISSDQSPVTGICKQLKLYNNENIGDFELYYYWSGGVQVKESDTPTGTEIKNAFGEASYTPSVTYIGSIEEKTSINIKDYLTIGSPARICIRSDRQKPSFIINQYGGVSQDSIRECAENTGGIKVELYVYGYMSYEKEE